MTYHDTTSSPGPEKLADETEIEITPEMIEAGVARLMDYDPNYSNEKDIVHDIIKIGITRMLPKNRQ